MTHERLNDILRSPQIATAEEIKAMATELLGLPNYSDLNDLTIRIMFEQARCIRDQEAYDRLLVLAAKQCGEDKTKWKFLVGRIGRLPASRARFVEHGSSILKSVKFIDEMTAA